MNTVNRNIFNRNSRFLFRFAVEWKQNYFHNFVGYFQLGACNEFRSKYNSLTLEKVKFCLHNASLKFSSFLSILTGLKILISPYIFFFLKKSIISYFRMLCGQWILLFSHFASKWVNMNDIAFFWQNLFFNHIYIWWWIQIFKIYIKWIPRVYKIIELSFIINP